MKHAEPVQGACASSDPRWAAFNYIDGVVKDECEEGEDLRAARRRIRLLEQEKEVLRRATAYLSQANLDPRLFPAVIDLQTTTLTPTHMLADHPRITAAQQ